MEEKQKEKNKTVSKEEIKLITFQPQQMLDEIEKLKDNLYSSQMENGYLKMVNITLLDDVKRLSKRSFKIRIQELLLRCLGGQWEEEKDEN